LSWLLSLPKKGTIAKPDQLVSYIYCSLSEAKAAVYILISLKLNFGRIMLTFETSSLAVFTELQSDLMLISNAVFFVN